jgi:hypothetical protein
MLRRAIPRPGLIVGLSAVAALLVPAAASAQETPVGELGQLVPAHTKHRNRFEQLITGAEQPGPDDKAVLQTFAQWYVFPMTFTQEKRETVPELRGRSSIHDLVDNFDRKIKNHCLPVADNTTNNKEFLKLWTGELIAAFRQVFERLETDRNKNRTAFVGTALLLPSYAKTKQPKFAEYLQGLITDEKMHDVVRLLAVKALRLYGPARAHKKSDDLKEEPELAQVIARDTKRVEALLQFVNRKWDRMDPAAAQFVRRAALRTLAETRVPAMDELQDGKVVAPVAYSLLRVLAPTKDSPNPPPSLTEKCEAALGVALMQAKHIDTYQPEPGLYLLGRFLLELVDEYRKDFANFGGKQFAVGAKKKADRPLTAQPWKVMAERLSKALPELEKGIRDKHPAHPKAVQLVNAAKGFLASMQLHAAISQPPGPLVQATNAFLPAASGGLLFKGNKEYQVQIAPLGGD